MLPSAISNPRPAKNAPLPVALLIACALCASTHGNAEERAQASKSEAVDLHRQVRADIESAFWACDYAATNRWVGLDEGATCGAIYEDLKRRKFEGDFQAMLEWWKRNKATAHRALAGPGGPLVSR